MNFVPFNDRVMASVSDTLAATGLSRTKFYSLVKRNIIETVMIDGRRYVIVASLKRLAEHGTPAVAA